MPTAAEFAALKDRINRAVEGIQRRGGTVVLLYMVACGERRQVEEGLFPRWKYWDQLASQTRALAIATEDYPDGSHLDAADTPAWSAALGRVIQRARTRH